MPPSMTSGAAASCLDLAAAAGPLAIDVAVHEELTLEPREFEVDRLQLGVAPGDLASLGLHLLLRDQHSCRGRQLRQVDGGCSALAEHAAHIAAAMAFSASADAVPTAQTPALRRDLRTCS
jgi:hypothetical protein